MQRSRQAKKAAALSPEEKQRAQRFGAWLRQQRKRRGMTQPQLASAANTDQSRISEFENARKIVSAEMAADIARALGVAQALALIEAGYITDLTTDDADAAVLFASLTGERREIARQMLVMLAGMEQGRRE